MALPMLMNNADCGPVNPLQGLAKRFDQDRGLQQDHFGAGRAGSSRETFRTQQAPTPSLEKEASRFFANGTHTNFSSPAPSTFDLSLLRSSLPPSHASTPSLHSTPPVQQPHAAASWASDFLKQQPRHSPAPQASSNVTTEVRQDGVVGVQSPVVVNPSSLAIGPQWVSQMSSMNYGAQWMPRFTQTHTPPAQSSLLWDKEFQSQEASFTHRVSAQPRAEAMHQEHEAAAYPQLADVGDLARTAGLLVETVKDEQNPKFKNSKFLGLMRQIRDGSVVVEGNDMVERTVDQVASSADVKGKGKERVSFLTGGEETLTGNALRGSEMTSSAINGVSVVPGNMVNDTLRQQRKSVHFDHQDEQSLNPSANEDPNEAYFRQDNEEYINYWNNTVPEQAGSSASISSRQGQTAEWGALQDDWDSFEATATGVRPIVNYPFQPRNPYLIGNSSRTRNHSIHQNTPQSFYESVLELEAAVQRDPTSARAWFDLGVKQQENEREPTAILALQQALALDPAHLPAWLALAISHTNENNRPSADVAIDEWVSRNVRYKDVVQRFRKSRSAAGLAQGQTQTAKHAELIECLMAMARSGSGDIDADVQIALAVLLNTNEDYTKAQDCFRTALAVRPDDWQLYNRVGATLANSGSAEEALQFYYRALELNPAYIRARFNLGISCINMRKYEEAAQHILDALVLQDSDGTINGPNDAKRGITSSALWESLKTTCLHLQRIDLASLCERQDLDGLRHEFNI